MMTRQRSGIPAVAARKKEILQGICQVYSRWAGRLPLACRKGCAACCTRSVTMTGLEGEVILDFVKNKGREKWLADRLAQAPPGKSRLLVTTNRFAAACLKQQEIDPAGQEEWDFTPCFFLEQNLCAIYEARPFGCRSFGSLAACSEDGAAAMMPIQLAANTVFTQIIEHLNSDGGGCGTMADILHSLAAGGITRHAPHLQPAQPLPGFLLAPGEARVIKPLLRELAEQCAEMVFFADLIDNRMLME